jgi:hypothetical protein
MVFWPRLNRRLALAGVAVNATVMFICRHDPGGFAIAWILASGCGYYYLLLIDATEDDP